MKDVLRIFADIFVSIATIIASLAFIFLFANLIYFGITNFSAIQNLLADANNLGIAVCGLLIWMLFDNLTGRKTSRKVDTIEGES